MDATTFGAIVGVVGTIMVAVVLAVRIGKEIRTNNSADL